MTQQQTQGKTSRIFDKVSRSKSQGTTGPQRDVLRAIRALIRSRGYSPSVREIADRLGVNVGDVHSKLARLRRDGMVRWDDGKARTIRVIA